MPPGGPAALGKLLLGLAAILAVVGVLLILSEKAGLRIGRLPGDIVVEREKFRFYFPLATSILLSVVLTLVFWLLGRRG